ncbi:MAG: histidine kinase [Phenylobacterium sp.]|nr:histidine kinase [Phenylobacterium sp.]
MNSAIAEPDARLASREANHRFLNTLTALHGLLRTDFGGFADPAVRDAVIVFSSRIDAFASVHRTLGDDSGEALLDASAHLARLCAELCAAHLEPRGLHCEFRCDSGTLPRETCQKLGLIIVELVTNAAKHAFADRRSGRVSVCLRRGERGWVCQVADNGSGLRGDRKGDGMTLVQGLAHALDGALTVHSDPAGVIVTVSLPDPPLDALLRAQAAAAPCDA